MNKKRNLIIFRHFKKEYGGSQNAIFSLMNSLNSFFYILAWDGLFIYKNGKFKAISFTFFTTKPNRFRFFVVQTFNPLNLFLIFCKEQCYFLPKGSTSIYEFCKFKGFVKKIYFYVFEYLLLKRCYWIYNSYAELKNSLCQNHKNIIFISEIINYSNNKLISVRHKEYKHTLAIIGDFYFVKGQDRVNDFIQNNSNLDIKRVIFVGSIRPGYEEWANKIIKQLSQKFEVQHYEKMSRKNLWDFIYKNSSNVLICSRSESFSYVAIEALNFGLETFVSNKIGVSELNLPLSTFSFSDMKVNRRQIPLLDNNLVTEHNTEVLSAYKKLFDV